MKLSEPQKRIAYDTKRFKVWVGGRRTGKTTLSIRELCYTAREPNKHCFAVFPSYRQAKQVAWVMLKDILHDLRWVKNVNEADLTVVLKNNSRISLRGAENSDALRGVKLDLICFDETSDIPEEAWTSVLRPTLSDTKGRACFFGTPKGRNQFYELYEQAKENKDWYACVFKASDTKILDQEELDAAKSVMSKDLYEQEFECSFQAAITGSYYGAIIEGLAKEGKITDVPYDDNLDTEVWYDLGLNDSTAMWFVQKYKGEIRLIDYYENSGYGLDHYADVLNEKGYEYSKHIFPHDVKVRELGNFGKTRLESLLELGIAGEVAPKLSIEDGIEAVRKALPNCWFDKEKCKTGIEYLKAYQKRWDDKNQCFKNKPMHNYASHCADSFRTGIIGQGAEISNWKQEVPINTNYIV